MHLHPHLNLHGFYNLAPGSVIFNVWIRNFYDLNLSDLCEAGQNPNIFVILNHKLKVRDEAESQK